MIPQGLQVDPRFHLMRFGVRADVLAFRLPDA
jgi:hypothetical protein